LIRPVARYCQSGEINFQIEDKDAALAELKETFGDQDATIDELDGVTIDAWDRQGWWCNVRKSNTEPLLRLNLESRDRRTLEAMKARIAPMLGTEVHH
jgi:phosphomannomutase